MLTDNPVNMYEYLVKNILVPRGSKNPINENYVNVRIQDIVGIVEVINCNELNIDVNKMEVDRDYSLEYKGNIHHVRKIDNDTIKIYEIDNKPSGWS